MIFLFNAHLALFVQRMTQLWSLNSISKYRHLLNRSNMRCALSNWRASKASETLSGLLNQDSTCICTLVHMSYLPFDIKRGHQ